MFAQDSTLNLSLLNHTLEFDEEKEAINEQKLFSNLYSRQKAPAPYPTAVFEAKKNMPGGVTSVGECVGGDCFFP